MFVSDCVRHYSFTQYSLLKRCLWLDTFKLCLRLSIVLFSLFTGMPFKNTSHSLKIKQLWKGGHGYLGPTKQHSGPWLSWSYKAAFWAMAILVPKSSILGHGYLGPTKQHSGPCLCWSHSSSTLGHEICWSHLCSTLAMFMLVPSMQHSGPCLCWSHPSSTL